jgi:hypothetical protein
VESRMEPKTEIAKTTTLFYQLPTLSSFLACSVKSHPERWINRETRDACLHVNGCGHRRTPPYLRFHLPLGLNSRVKLGHAKMWELRRETGGLDRTYEGGTCRERETSGWLSTWHHPMSARVSFLLFCGSRNK